MAQFNDAPKQDAHKMRQAQETISLLKKATNTFERGTEFLGLRSGSPDAVSDEETEEQLALAADPYHRIPLVSETDAQEFVREIAIPKDNNPNSIELQTISGESKKPDE